MNVDVRSHCYSLVQSEKRSTDLPAGLISLGKILSTKFISLLQRHRNPTTRTVRRDTTWLSAWYQHHHFLLAPMSSSGYRIPCPSRPIRLSWKRAQDLRSTSMVRSRPTAPLTSHALPLSTLKASQTKLPIYVG